MKPYVASASATMRAPMMATKVRGGEGARTDAADERLYLVRWVAGATTCTDCCILTKST